MKLRLFSLRDTRTNKILSDTYFSSKPEAKRARDAANENGGQYVVTPGPDHRKALAKL